WRQLQARLDGKEWKVGTRELTYANFGRDERAARRVLEVLRYYRCNERYFVGRSAFSFFLSNGQSPRCMMVGLSATSFRPNLLEVKQAGTAWVITDGTRVLFQFEDRESEARQALAKILHYGFDHVAQLDKGAGVPLTLLVKSY